MASGSTNMYDLLNNDEQHSKKPREHEGPGKPDKTEQRRSVPREQKQNPSGNPSANPAHQRNRVDDRDRRGGRGGASRGGRGGRGGYHGSNSDGVHRNFDRKQGEHHKHAPGEARKHGAVGEANPSAFSGSSEEFQAQDAAATADANGDIVGDEILDITPMPTDPDDGKLTYDEYIASRAAPDDDVNRNIREVDDGSSGDFQKAKKLVKEEVGLFGEVLRDEDEDAADRRAGGKKNKKNKISLDEFVGAGAASASSPSERGGRGGASSGRGGRGGFQGDSAPRGGRGGFDGNRGGRGGRGGFDGARGGRGGNQQQPQRGGARGGRAPAANVNLADQSAFPALSPK